MRATFAHYPKQNINARLKRDVIKRLEKLRDEITQHYIKRGLVQFKPKTPQESVVVTPEGNIPFMLPKGEKVIPVDLPTKMTSEMDEYERIKDRIIWYLNENGTFEVVAISEDPAKIQETREKAMREAFEQYQERKRKREIEEAHNAGEMIVTEAQNKAMGLPKHTIAMKPWEAKPKPWNAAYSIADIRKMIENKPKWWQFWK